jgi:large repetitive protein
MMSLSLLIWAGSAMAQVPTGITFQPAFGKPGTSVKITGANFSTAKSVTFNSVSAIFYIESATVIRATVPEGALSGPIGVNNAAGPGSSESSFFTVAPRVFTLTPDRGLSGRTVVIQGDNLDNTTNVYFGGIAASSITVSPSQISATIPVGATNAPVTVKTTVGSAVTTNDFLITDVPVIRSFTPTVASVGTSVVIDGGDFTGVTNVLFNGQPAASFIITALNQIQATIPATATTGPIKVHTPGGVATSATNLITGAGPIVTGFSPSAGPVGKQVIITGTGFDNSVQAVSVQFNGTPITAGFVSADTQIQTFVPAGATTGPIKVTKGTNVFITTSNFIVGAFPLITSVSPEIGSVNTPVVINGENLNAVTSLRFGTVAASITHTADTQIQTTVPTGATNALIYLANSTFTNSSRNVFVVNGTAPTIVDFLPKNGAPGSPVTLYGYNFNGTTAVQLNGTAVQTFQVTSISGTNQIAVSLPANATSGAFSVTTSGGTGASTNLFHVWPHISSFGPAKATALTSLTVTGVNFTATSEVRIGDVPASFFPVTDNTRLGFFVPEAAVTAPITIRTPAGLITTITNFAMLPKLDTLTPDRGRAGDSVIIGGSGFFNVTSVKFNGLTASFTNDSVNRITATVPTGVTSGPVTVVTGEGTTVSVGTFYIFPTVTDFTPKSGPYGTIVVFTGLNFSDVTNMTFSAVNVDFTVDSATQITATIPVALSGNLKLYNPAGITITLDVFTVEPQIQSFFTAEGKLVMQWPIDAPVFRVESTPSLTPPVIWTDENATVYTLGNLRTVTNTPSGTSKFYRLIFQFPE